MRLSRTAAAALLVGVAAAVVAPGPVQAHEEVPGVRAVIDSVQPPLPAGVTVQTVISVSDQVIAENTTAVDLEVLGEGGEPFLRIGPQGVFANLRSPTWYRSNDPTGTAVPPASADAAAPPQFARVTAERSWGWFDHRLHRTRLAAAPAVADPLKPNRLEEWFLPMRYGATEVVVKGHREYQLPPGSFQSEVTRSPGTARAVAFPGVVPAIALYVPEGSPQVTVLGEAGEPMVRVSAAGAEVNEASPSWDFTARARGRYTAPGPVGAAEPPRWRKASGTGQVTWLERRAQVVTATGVGTPGQQQAWRVPVLVGPEAGAIEGVTRWVATRLPARPVPRRGRAGGNPLIPGWAWWFGAGAVAAGAAAGAAVGVGRLRRRRPG